MTKKILMLGLCCIFLASIGVVAAASELWFIPDPSMFVYSEGPYIYTQSFDSVAKYDANGNQVWKTSCSMSNSLSFPLLSKYFYVISGDGMIHAYNKTDGKSVWASNSNNTSWLLVSGNYLISVAMGGSGGFLVLDRDTGAVVKPFTSTQPCHGLPAVCQGKLVIPAEDGIHTYLIYVKPDLTVRNITRFSGGLNFELENLGTDKASKVLLKFIVQKTDGSYRTIHMSAGDLPAKSIKTVQLKGNFTKGYINIDPYYTITEFNENNNQRYFS